MTTDYLSDDLPHQVPHKAPKAIPRVYVRSALPPATLSSGCYGLRCSASTQMDLSNVSNSHLHNEKVLRLASMEAQGMWLHPLGLGYMA